MREVTEEKKRTKKKKLRQCGSSPEEIKLLAEKFYLAIRRRSKLVKEVT